MSVGRLFATSVPRWNISTSVDPPNIAVQQSPESMDGRAATPLDAGAIKARLAQLRTPQEAIQKAELEACKLNRNRMMPLSPCCPCV